MMPAWFWIAFLFLFGSIVGSFLNVCVWRLPRGESIVRPGSRCPACRTPIGPADNVPILSWLLLKGRCRSCGAPISSRYPLVELLTAVLFALVAWRAGVGLILVPYLALVAAMVAVFFIDLDHQIIPHEITLPGIVLGLAATPLLPHTLIEGALGVVVGIGFFYLAAVYSEAILGRESMGGGDINLAAMMGAFLGWKLLAVAVFISLMLGSAVGLTLILSGRRERRDPIPFGPFLSAGTVVAILWGPELLDWYLNLGG